MDFRSAIELHRRGQLLHQALTNAVVGTVTDANQSAPSGDFTGTIDWGDGPNENDGTSVSTATFQAISGQPGTFNILGSHTYSTFGSFTIAVTAQDEQQSPLTADASVSLSAPTITVGSTLLGPGETLEVPVSLSGDNVASQSLTIASYDSSVVQVGWENGSVTDASGNATLLVTGLDVGQTDVVVALANFANVQGAGNQAVGNLQLSLSDTSLTVCSVGVGRNVTATLKNPDNTPVANKQLAWTFDPAAIDVDPGSNIGATDNQGNVTFTVKGKSSTGFEPSTTLAITATSGQNTVEADCYVAVIPPTITISPPGPFQMNYDINHIPQKSAITVEITDPTNGDAPIVGVSVDISVADPTVAGIDAGMWRLTGAATSSLT